jgi:hypothetical protein
MNILKKVEGESNEEMMIRLEMSAEFASPHRGSGRMSRSRRKDREDAAAARWHFESQEQ